MTRNFLVQKFGGTSVGQGDRLSAVVNIIEHALVTNRVVAVVSAMSPEKKDTGTTSLLLKAIDLASHGNAPDEPIEQIRIYHCNTINSSLTTSQGRNEAEAFIKDELRTVQTILEQKLGQTLGQIERSQPISLSARDEVLAVGERLSAKLLSILLQERGIDARYCDLSNLLSDGFSESSLPAHLHSDNLTKYEGSTTNRMFDTAERNLAQRLLASNADVTVLTGYFGIVEGGMLEKVGRGYTDFTAALATAGLGCDRVEELQVWKEVDGICTADPRKVANARVIEALSTIEASELTHFGSEVLHPFTMSRVAQANIPIRVKNTFKPELPGTVVSQTITPHSFPITAITAKRAITTITVESNRMYDTYGFLAQVFSILSDHQIIVDLVSTSEISISFTVESIASIKDALPELERLGNVNIDREKAILAVVGENMRHAFSSTPAQLFHALANVGVEAHMISKGASQINLSCVISSQDLERALLAVHDQFFGATPMTSEGKP